jgi:hypothetical protein
VSSTSNLLPPNTRAPERHIDKSARPHRRVPIIRFESVAIAHRLDRVYAPRSQLRIRWSASNCVGPARAGMVIVVEHTQHTLASLTAI